MINAIIKDEPNLKYWFEFTNIERDIFRCEILEKDFEGEPVEIHGNVKVNYAERKDLTQAIVASHLDINIEANKELTMQDLYAEDERHFSVKLLRNAELIFYGYLIPDGIWEDWVYDSWQISISAIDGLSILKNLSFVKDDGTFYTGKITQFDALKQCLKRIGYNLPINVSSDLPTYNGFYGGDSILHSVKMNTERFYFEKATNNIMDCESVLKSILETYNATVIQMNGEWWVFRSIDVKNEMHFHKYDGETITDNVWNAELNIGSHIDQYEVFHANANQKKSINPSAQAFRVNYKYGTVKSVNENPDIILDSGLTAEGWNINNPDAGVFPNDDGSGINAKIVQSDSSWFNNKTLLIENNGDDFIQENEIVSVRFSFENSGYAGSGTSYIGIHYEIQTDLYQLTVERNGTAIRWVLKSALNASNDFWKFFQPNGSYGNGLGKATLSIDLPPFPEDSNIKIKVFRDVTYSSDYSPDYRFIVNSIEVIPAEGSNIKGEFHTAQRLTRISSVTKADKTVSVGDSISDIYYGTLYKENGDPTTVWSRTDRTESLGILQIMVEDNLRISPRPMVLFTGDVFGYFPYLSKVLINNINGKFQISKYSYECKDNINRADFKEFASDYLLPADFRYEMVYDYGNETKVTVI